MKTDATTGFFDLQTPLDLLEKMEADCNAMVQGPGDVYSAFNFFVAAHHLPDWLGKYKCSPGGISDEPGRSYVAICEQLANGAKHFSTNQGYTAVQGHNQTTWVIPSATLIVGNESYPTVGGSDTKLFIEIGPEEAAALGATAIVADVLARKVLDYWKSHPSVERARTLKNPN